MSSPTPIEPINFPKRRKALIKFKTMAEILLTENAYFDYHGNLTVNSYYNSHETSHLAPMYFCYLGKLKQLPSGCSFPRWCIESEYDDIFKSQMALRKISSGKLSLQECQGVAGKELLEVCEAFGWEKPDVQI